ncbi:cupredoxin domain-containing protein [Sphingosinicella humi]|uniref:EfeO-type cupredoxin-like domain-containing protein n=1 Tax=Allosphingosinicella humi TaxID=2068657 RepID=A0A2U2IZ16_9SPHN|nr:cupredoxin domain-containing protein [Sphingosinicella humi]PWG01281.1 hypothetical protein DF286_14220 [Sphingosinicella humi]
MARGTLLLMAAGLALLPPSSTFGAASIAYAAAPKVHTVVMDKMKFGPVPKNIRAGDTILWVNRDMFRHTATARDKSFNIDLPAGKSGKTVIRKSGKIPFYCIFHPGMKGQLVVAK